MVKHQRKRKLRGGIVGALIGLASIGIPYLIDALSNQGPSREEQEAAIREDYYARLAEWDRQRAEEKAAEQERQRIEQQKKNMIANSRAGQAERKRQEQILAEKTRQAKLSQMKNQTAQLPQQRVQLQTQIQDQSKLLADRNAIRMGELAQRQQTQQQRLATQQQISQQKMDARQQVMERQLEQKMKALSAIQQTQEQPTRRYATTERTNPFAISGSGVNSDLLSVLRHAYGLSLSEAKQVLASL